MNFFYQIPFFEISKMAKNQFLNWAKSSKLPKIQFHVKIFLIYLISRVFLHGLFFIFWPDMNLLASSGKKKFISKIFNKLHQPLFISDVSVTSLNFDATHVTQMSDHVTFQNSVSAPNPNVCI